MRQRPGSGFTLIELMVVIAIIAVLMSIIVVLLETFTDTARRAQCASNLNQMGKWLVMKAMKSTTYPEGGKSPGHWADTFGLMASELRTSDISRCPAADLAAPDNPKAHGTTCSYAYVGNLNPTYTCKCSECGEDPGKKIWSLVWSGVLYTGNHDRDNISTFMSYKLSDNLRWNSDAADEDESKTQPTVPEHLDYEKFSTKDRVKFRDQRALRQVPTSMSDKGGQMPLMMDLVIMIAKPSGVLSWTQAHNYVTESNRYDTLWANHCGTSATKKKNWGCNILYTNHSVKWKDWKELRFQVMVRKEDVGGGSDQYYFY